MAAEGMVLILQLLFVSA